MNICLIYLTEWVKQYHAYIVNPQRWVMGIDGFSHPADPGPIGPDLYLPRTHPRRSPIKPRKT